MKRVSDILRRWRDQWALGAGVLVIAGLSVLLFGCGAAILLALLGPALGLDDAGMMDWLWVSAILWLPLSLGLALPYIRDLGKRDDDCPPALYRQEP
jgi:hypothetical protein